jgi:hypothetical protein
MSPSLSIIEVFSRAAHGLYPLNRTLQYLHNSTITASVPSYVN